MSAGKYLIAVVLKEFHFLLGEGGHGDGLDSVRRIEAPPGTHRGETERERKEEVEVNKQEV